MQILNKEISCIKFKFEAIELVLSALAPSILTPEPERSLLLCTHLSKLHKNTKIYLELTVNQLHIGFYCSQMAFLWPNIIYKI